MKDNLSMKYQYQNSTIHTEKGNKKQMKI
jgi:hypothetical protein